MWSPHPENTEEHHDYFARNKLTVSVTQQARSKRIIFTLPSTEGDCATLQPKGGSLPSGEIGNVQQSDPQSLMVAVRVPKLEITLFGGVYFTVNHMIDVMLLF